MLFHMIPSMLVLNMTLLAAVILAFLAGDWFGRQNNDKRASQCFFVMMLLECLIVICSLLCLVGLLLKVIN